MYMPNLSDFNTLEELEVKRINMDNFLFDSIYNNYSIILNSVLIQKFFNLIF